MSSDYHSSIAVGIAGARSRRVIFDPPETTP
jgi:hypothetical protein